MVPKRPISLLMAEDDPDDRAMVKEALKSSGLDRYLACVNDGEELLDYLLARGAYSGRKGERLPDLILLDLYMPKKNGFEALKEIKQNSELRAIPIVVLTTSKSDEDILLSYDLQASSFLTKPVTFQGFVRAMEALAKYYGDIASLPKTSRGGGRA